MDVIGGVGVPPSPPPFCDEASQYASQKNPVTIFGCHNIFRKAVFPLGPIVFFVTCHNSLPPPHPHPLSGAQIRSITVTDVVPSNMWGL